MLRPVCVRVWRAVHSLCPNELLTSGSDPMKWSFVGLVLQQHAPFMSSIIFSHVDSQAKGSLLVSLILPNLLPCHLSSISLSPFTLDGYERNGPCSLLLSPWLACVWRALGGRVCFHLSARYVNACRFSTHLLQIYHLSRSTDTNMSWLKVCLFLKLRAFWIYAGIFV